MGLSNFETQYSFHFYFTLLHEKNLSLTHSAKLCPEGVPEKRPDALRTCPYGPICNAKERILIVTSLGRTQDINLTIIHEIDFYGFFSIFPDSNCI